MKSGSWTVAVIVSWLFLIGAGPANLAGEYADKKFLNGQAVFQLGVEPSGDGVSISFSAGYNDGHGAAPEADGKGKVTSKNTVEFNWEDSFNNSGTGTIAPSGDGVVVSIKANRVADSRCLVFYQQHIRLSRVKK